VTYTVVLLREPVGGYTVLVPAFGGAATQGEDLGDAIRMTQDLIQLLLEVLADDHKPAPPDVSTVSFDWGEASEAMVCRVSVGEAVVA